MSILLVFFFHFKCFSQAEPFECLSCFSHTFRTEFSYMQFFVADRQRRFNTQRTGWRDCTTLINHQHGNNNIDLFCYKIYMFPHENISKQSGVFNRWILLIKRNIHCPLSIFLYQKITVYIGGSAHFRFQRTTRAS